MPRSKTDCIRKIRKINARFRKLKKRDGPLGDRLARLKDIYIELIQQECEHPKAYETAGASPRPPFGRPGSPLRICTACGLSESPSAPDGYTRLILVPVRLDHDAFKIEMSKILKKIGIDLH